MEEPSRRTNLIRNRMAFINDQLDDSLLELQLPLEEMHELPNGEARQIYEVARAIFVKGDPRVWWLSLRQPHRSVDTDDSAEFRFLRDNWPVGETSCYFVPENEEATPRVFEASLNGLIKILGNTNGFFEYNLVGKDFRWLMIETDHNQLIISERDGDGNEPSA